MQQIPTVHLGPPAHQMEKRGSRNFSRQPEPGHSSSQQPDAVHPQCHSWCCNAGSQT
ncbi:MAG: hypothetical protein ACLU9R_04265 [Faecalibacterium sp.]